MLFHASWLSDKYLLAICSLSYLFIYDPSQAWRAKRWKFIQNARFVFLRNCSVEKWFSMTRLLICDFNLVKLEKADIAVSLENRFACYIGYEGDVTCDLSRVSHENWMEYLNQLFKFKLNEIFKRTFKIQIIRKIVTNFYNSNFVFSAKWSRWVCTRPNSPQLAAEQNEIHHKMVGLVQNSPWLNSA